MRDLLEEEREDRSRGKQRQRVRKQNTYRTQGNGPDDGSVFAKCVISRRARHGRVGTAEVGGRGPEVEVSGADPAASSWGGPLGGRGRWSAGRQVSRSSARGWYEGRGKAAPGVSGGGVRTGAATAPYSGGRGAD